MIKMINTTEETIEDFDSYFIENLPKNKISRKDPNLEKLYSDLVVKNPQKGDVHRANYSGLIADHHLFTVNGFKDDIRVDNKASESIYLDGIVVGSEVDVLITDINSGGFLIKGSIATIHEAKAHDNLKALNKGESVLAHVKSLNPAGYDLEIIHEGVKVPGFMPNTLAGINKLYKPESILNEKFQVMIESYAEHEKTYIVSRRKYLQSLIPSALKELQYNVLYTGRVTGTTPFGVFVEFNECLTGMIHKVNIVPEYRERIQEIKPGQLMEFLISDIVNNKIILTQITTSSLWDTVINGQKMVGKIKAVKKYGVLVALDETTNGLIKSSEAERSKVKFEVGQDIEVKVLFVDRGNRKIFLTNNL